MKTLTAVTLLILLFWGKAWSQTSEDQVELPVSHFNKFQTYLYEKPNVDSAYHSLTILASKKAFSPLLKSLLYNSFVQTFTNDFFPDHSGSDSTEINVRKKIYVNCKSILIKAEEDTLDFLKEVIHPIALWAQIFENQKDTNLLKELVDEFLTDELIPSKFYENKTGRFGLMIYTVISKRPELKSQAGLLFKSIKDQLRIHQVPATEISSRDEFEKRAWYRYLYAYCCNLEAASAVDLVEKERLLKMAYEHSPDLFDINYGHGYFYDMHLLGGKESYKEDYANFLIEAKAEKDKILPVLLEMALSDPIYKAKLRDYYTQSNPADTGFDTFWLGSIEKNAYIASAISTHQLDGTPFSTETHEGKWILVDFWGTWCGPCREEHPDLQKFYTTTIEPNPDKIQLLTIACMDKKQNVESYMKQTGLTFPVAMSDGTFELNYKVQSYPTKILITPNGKYIRVPWGIDWINFIKQYTGL